MIYQFHSVKYGFFPYFTFFLKIELMMEIQEKSPLLYEKTQLFDFNNPPFDIEEFSIDLVNLMMKKLMLGVAANQVGYQYRIFAIIGDPQCFVCVNPKIVHKFGEIVELEETSFSYPGLVFDIERHKEIRLRFQGPNGEFFTRPFTGMTARIVQQMVDHLDGIPFWESISRLKFDMAVRKAQKLGHDYSTLRYKPKSSIILPD